MNSDELRKEMDPYVWGCRGPDCVGDEAWFTIDDQGPQCFVKLHCGHFTSVDICEIANGVTQFAFACYVDPSLSPANLAKEFTRFHRQMSETILRLTRPEFAKSQFPEN